MLAKGKEMGNFLFNEVVKRIKNLTYLIQFSTRKPCQHLLFIANT